MGSSQNRVGENIPSVRYFDERDSRTGSGDTSRESGARRSSRPVVLALRIEAFLTEGAKSPGRNEMTRLTRTPFLRAVALFGALLLPALQWAETASAQTADATVELSLIHISEPTRPY